MNRQNASFLWPIMKAYASGAPIEVWMPDYSTNPAIVGCWVPCNDPAFDAKFKYRVQLQEPSEYPAIPKP